MVLKGERMTRTVIKIETLISFLTFVYLASSYVFIMFTWGRYIMFAAILLIFLLYVYTNRGILQIPERQFIERGLLFVIFCFSSIIWSASKSNALSRSITLLEVFLCTYVIFLNYYNKSDIKPLLNVLMWSGYAEGIVLCFYYGIRNILSFSVSINGDFGNQNMIGMVMAINIVVTIYMMLFERPRFVHIFAILSVLLLAESMSRTAMLGCLTGIVVLFGAKIKSEKSFIKKLEKILGILLVLVVFTFFLGETGVFDSLFDRLRELALTLKGDSGDSSSRLRIILIEEGFKQFLKTPFFGLGINNSFQVAMNAVGHNYYLHNNYIDMLVNGGLIGFLCYASLYVYPIVSFIKYRKYADNQFYISLAILVSILIMDVGTVSYYAKETYFFLMIFFVEASRLKKRQIELSSAQSILE